MRRATAPSAPVAREKNTRIDLPMAPHGRQTLHASERGANPHTPCLFRVFATHLRDNCRCSSFSIRIASRIELDYYRISLSVTLHSLHSIACTYCTSSSWSVRTAASHRTYNIQDERQIHPQYNMPLEPCDSECIGCVGQLVQPLHRMMSQFKEGVIAVLSPYHPITCFFATLSSSMQSRCISLLHRRLIKEFSNLFID